MPDLVAIDLPGGSAFVAAVRRAWDAGDAVAPLDRSAPPAQRERLLSALAPTVLVDAHGTHRLSGGRAVDPGDAVVLTTSGTTAAPKAVVLGTAAVEYAAFAAATSLGVEADTCWLACLPLHHVGGFSVVSRALFTGTDLVVHDGFEAAAVERAAADGATHVSLVPTALRRIDPTPWRRILLGGSAVPVDRPANCVAGYGMTETGGGIVHDGLPLSGVSVRIADAPAGALDPSGPIEVSSPTLLRCYRSAEGDVDPVSGDGWFRTGDLGTVESATGRLRVHGRADDVIVSGGENVWPEAVEAVLRTHPGVTDVAVVGRVDPEWGEVVLAIVVPTDASAPPALDDLRDHVRHRLPPAAAPRRLELRDRIPRTSLGKPERRTLSR